VDHLGNLWVADWGNGRVARFDAADLTTNGAPAKFFLGVPSGTTFGGVGGGKLPGPNNMDGVSDVCTGPNGDIYVADSGFCRVLRFAGIANLPRGRFGPAATTLIGQKDFYSITSHLEDDGFFGLQKITVDAAGTLYASDSSWGRVSIFSNAAAIASGGRLSLAIGQTTLDGNQIANPPTANLLRRPAGVTIDYAGRLWVTDFTDNRILRYSPGDAPTFTLQGKKRLRTPARFIRLRGRIHGAPGTRVYVQIGKKGKVRPAKGTQKWSFKAALQVGTNIIKIYALDTAARKSKVETVVVVRY
jgi:sugar lactone lactonase YvrE